MRRSLIAAGIILLLIIAIIWAFARRGSAPQQQPEVARQSNLVDFADTRTEVRYTIEGRINARENHRVIQFLVGKDYRTIQIFDGYQGSILQQQTYLNDRDAYRAFLAALHNEGYTRTRDARRNIDPLGVCPLGQRFRYDIVEGNDVKQSLWDASCSGVRGTFDGRSGTINSLFKLQIPNYEELTRGINL